MNKIILNATCIGSKPDGIGIYCRNIIERIIIKNTLVRYIIYINEEALAMMSHLTNTDQVIVKVTPRFLSPKYGFFGHLLRFLFSNYLSLVYPRTIIFNPSQLEASINNNNQILMVHDLIPLLFNNDPILRNPIQFFFFKYILGTAIRKSAAILAPSKHTMALIKKEFYPNPEKMFVIPNGIDSPEKVSPLKKEENFILYVGRLSATKNITALINAYRKIADKVSHKLIIAGGGDNKFLIDGDPGGPGTIEYVGYVSDKKKGLLLSKASLFVFPSFYEGFGFPPLEAMAHGCPTIVSKVSSLPEICGEASLYIDPNNTDNIANVMNKLLLNNKLQNQLIKSGYDQVKKYTWERSAVGHVNVIDIIKSRGK
tara:strand:+ start:480 stop:1589 length:1110 start_codon:yes stop_codon:yes gene_type:complete